MTIPVQTSSDARRFSCPGCGSNLRYDIKSQNLLCDSCGGSYPVTVFPDSSEQSEDSMYDVVEYVCPSCGAALHTSQTAITSFCSYCGADVVLTERIARTRRPDRILPFRITREDCEDIYRKRLQESRFVPGVLKKQETIRHFRPIYIPFWSYSFKAEGPAEGRGTKKWHDKEYNYNESYQYTIKSSVSIDGLLYDASSAFEDETAQKLQFRDINTVAFHPAYLCGIYAEASDTGESMYRDALKAVANDKLNKDAVWKTTEDVYFPLPEDQSVKTELVLMPVWLLADRRGERVLYTAINGDSGHIICDPPVSFAGFAAVAAALSCAVLAVLLAVTRVILLRPNLVLAICCILAVVLMSRIVPEIDTILIRRVRDLDPTRIYKAEHPDSKSAVIRKDTLGETESERKRRQEKKKNGIAALIIIALSIGFPAFCFLIAGIMEYGGSRVLGLLISDRGVLVPVILILMAILLFRIHYDYKNLYPDPGRKRAGMTDYVLLMAMRIAICVSIFVTIFPVPGVSLWCYSLSMVMMVLLTGNILRLTRLQDEYVTRPVPFFAKEEQT